MFTVHLKRMFVMPFFGFPGVVMIHSLGSTTLGGKPGPLPLV